MDEPTAEFNKHQDQLIKYEQAYRQWMDYIEDDLDAFDAMLCRLRDKSVLFESHDGTDYDFSEELNVLIHDLV